VLHRMSSAGAMPISIKNLKICGCQRWGARSTGWGEFAPLVEIGLTDLPRWGGGGEQWPPWFRYDLNKM
jgi:hypothetical protein